MATVLLEPATSQVTGTHSNFPVLITPSAHTNIGSLTLAEAQSVRIYTDASLTTEIAREVVSADEIWAKVPSLSSTTDLYFDWDGVRADYAVGATYGAENVWTPYSFVSHDGGATDSAGNHTPTGYGGITMGAATGNFTKATTFDGVNDYIEIGSDTNVLGANPDTVVVSAWYRQTNTSGSKYVWATYDTVSGSDSTYLENRNINNEPYFLARSNNNTSGNFSGVNTTINTWNKNTFRMTKSDTQLRGYVNGVEELNINLVSTGDYTDGGGFHIGGLFINNAISSPFAGQISEIRIGNTDTNSDWETTEYNNQNNNGAFWDDSSVGGAPAFVPIISMIN